MNRKQILGAAIAVLVSSTLSFGQTTSTQCTATTKQSVQCKNVTKNVSQLCGVHDPNHVSLTDKVTVICSGTTKTGNNCKRKTKNTSGLCYNHKKD
tara:strand:+ start:103 stop:390 length:288 start_codon:yes stop_codon:yes gene_type:complete